MFIRGKVSFYGLISILRLFFFYGHEGEMAPKAKHSIKDEAKRVLLLLALWSLECHFDMCPSGLGAALACTKTAKGEGLGGAD